jgi:poly-beta-1,6-N-acetyl-D-glucosamine synthase
MSQRRYCLITPCRDEAQYARRTLDSVVEQSVPPALWLIIDDGSTDQTPEILAEYAAKHPFIKILRRDDRGFRKLGGGVIDAFYHGYDTINPDDFDYVCKFDLDLDVPPRYFEILMRKMEADPRLGTASGKPYFRPEAKPAAGHPQPPAARTTFPIDPSAGLIMETCGDENSVGMTKFYRTACFKEIGGFVRELMWDGIDCHRCRMLGWRACSWDDPALRFTHLRPMGSSQVSLWEGRKRHGQGQWFMGTGPLYMLASALFRATKRPYVLGGAAMMAGYLRAWWSGAPRYPDLEFRRFLRRYQWDCLFRGKGTATRRLDRTIREALAGTSRAAVSEPA